MDIKFPESRSPESRRTVLYKDGPSMYNKHMPAKNRLKQYVENGYYHIYNRGVVKSDIFLDKQDYAVFLSYLKEYLSPPVPPSEEETKKLGYYYFRKNYHQKINLIAFVLMPNHFHFLVKQIDPRIIEGLMRSLITRYSRYFNKHHDRVGHLLQDVYKGVLVEKEEYFLWLSRYIHRNPLEIIKEGSPLSSYPYSSYPTYLGLQETSWLETTYILKQAGNYKDFVEGSNTNVDTNTTTNRAGPEDLELYTLALDSP